MRTPGVRWRHFLTRKPGFAGLFVAQPCRREGALVGPWTMGRDKKNPKPLDITAFHTLVKTANEFVRRHEQQLHATLHQSITVTADAGRITVHLDIVPDDDNPYAVLSARDDSGDTLAEVKVAPSFKLTRSSAVAWVDGGFAKPR